jgi:hypothetical protein
MRHENELRIIWDDDMLAILHQGIEEGWALSKTAAVIGVSRSALENYCLRNSSYYPVMQPSRRQRLERRKRNKRTVFVWNKSNLRILHESIAQKIPVYRIAEKLGTHRSVLQRYCDIHSIDLPRQKCPAPPNLRWTLQVKNKHAVWIQEPRH